MHVGFLHHRYQGVLCPPPRLEEGREVTPIPYAGHAHVDAAHPRIPLSLPIAIALTPSCLRALMPCGAHVRAHLQFHQALAEESHPLTQKVHVAHHLHLAQQLLKCHAHLVGHLGVLLLGFGFASQGNPRDGRSRQPVTLLHTSLDTVGKFRMLAPDE